MAEDRVDIEAAIRFLEELNPGGIRAVTAKPGHQYYEGVRRAGPLSKCKCGQQNLGWRYPEFIAVSGKTVWSVHRDAKTNKITCGPKGYHSTSYSNTPPCCREAKQPDARAASQAVVFPAATEGATTGRAGSFISTLTEVREALSVPVLGTWQQIVHLECDVHLHPAQ